MKKIWKKGKGVVAFLMAVLMLVGLLPSTEMPVSAAETSTVIYNAATHGKKPNGNYGYLNTVTLTGASVESFEVSDTTINVHLMYTTASDATMSLAATAGGNMVKLSPTSAEVTLVDGVATQKFTVSPKYNGVFTATTFTVNIDIASEEDHTHNYNILEVVDETSHKKSCGCGDAVTENHSFGSWTKQDDTNHVKTCACGASVTEEHTLSDWTSVDFNNHQKTCSVCSGTVTAAHKFGDAVAADDEKHIYPCSDCSGGKNEPHAWDVGTVTVEATEDEPGSKRYTCTVCGREKTETIYLNEVETILTVSGVTLPSTSTYAKSFKVSGAALATEDSYAFVNDSTKEIGTTPIYAGKYPWKWEPVCNVTLAAGTPDGTVIKVRTNEMSSTSLIYPADYTLDAAYVSAEIQDGQAEVIFPMVYASSTYEYQADWHFVFTVEQEHVCEFGDWMMDDTETHTRTCDDANCGETETKPHTLSYTKVNDKVHNVSCSDACGYNSVESHTWNDGEVTTAPTTTTTGEKLYTCTAESCGATKTEVMPCIPTSVIKIKVDDIKIPSSYGYVREFALDGADVYGIAEVDSENSSLSPVQRTEEYEETNTAIKYVYDQKVTANVSLAAGTEDGTEIKVRLPEEGFHTVITSSGTMTTPANWTTYVSAVVEDGKAAITYPMTYVRNSGITAEGKRVSTTYNVEWVFNFTVDETASVENAPESVDVRLVKVNGSEDSVYSIPYEDADDYEDWVVLDENLYIGKDGDVFTFKAYDQNNNETPVVWIANEEIDTEDFIDAEGNYTVKYLSFGGVKFNYIRAISKLNPAVTQEKRFFMNGYKLGPFYQNPVIELSEDGQEIASGHVNAGVKGHTDWSVEYPETNAAKLEVKDASQDGIQFNYIALRPGTFDVTYALDFNKGMTETTTVTVKGVAVEDSTGAQQKTYVEMSNDNANPTTKLTAYAAEGLTVTGWSSEDETVATVDANGLVTAQGVGSVIIHATDSEGNVGGIKVVVTHADIPYFEELNFARGNAGLNPHKWAEDSFKAALMEYEVETNLDTLATLPVTAVFNAEKWTASYEITYDDGSKAATGNVANGEETNLPINGKACMIRFTIADQANAENKNTYVFAVNRELYAIPTSIDVQLVAVNGSKDNIYRTDYEDADDYADWVVMDDYIYYGKNGDQFTFKAYDQTGNETPVTWTIDEGIADKSGVIDENGVFTVDYLTFAVNGFHYVKATSTLDEKVSQEKMYVMTGYGLHPAYQDPTVELDEDGKEVTGNINAGVKGHTEWSVTYPKTNAAKIIETGVIQNGIEFDFQALRPGTFDVTYEVDFNEDMTETTTVTVKGVAVEDNTGAQQKTYVEMSNNNANPTTKLTAYAAEGLKVTGWSSEDETVATVDVNGLVTAQGVGSVIIHATDSEGNVGGIKVVVTHADIPYFEELNFARGNAGLNPHKWAEDSFKAALMEYEVETYFDTLATLPVTAVFNADKWEASYEITYDDGSEAATGNVANGVVTYLPINGKACVVEITIYDPEDSDNKNVYVFAVNCELPEDSEDNQETVKGDTNGDGAVTLNDAMQAYKLSKDSADATEAQKAAADVNGDGSITLADAMMIYQMSKGTNNE